MYFWNSQKFAQGWKSRSIQAIPIHHYFKKEGGFSRTNKKGELVRKSAQIKHVKGFQTGDMIKAVVPKGKKKGVYVGRVAVRSSGSFNIKTLMETVQGINYKYCTVMHKKDGYTYGF